MPQIIKLKRSSSAGQVPTTAQLDLGEVAINTWDGRFYFKQDDGTEKIYELNTRQNEGFFEEYMDFATTSGIKLPVGTTVQRPTGANLKQGSVRYNSTDSTFEGYDGVNWGSLGGVKDVNQDTYIQAETSPGANNDELEFYIGGTKVGKWDATRLDIDNKLNVDGDVTMNEDVTIGNASSDILTVNAQAAFKSHLSIDGNTTIGNASSDTLTVNATTTFANNVTVNGDLNVADGSSFTFGSGANRVTYTGSTTVTVSNEAGTVIFTGKMLV